MSVVNRKQCVKKSLDNLHEVWTQIATIGVEHRTMDLSSCCCLQFSGLSWGGQMPWSRRLCTLLGDWLHWAHPSRPFMGPIYLGRNNSQIYPHMRAKFGHDRSSRLAAYTSQTYTQNLYYIDIDRGSCLQCNEMQCNAMQYNNFYGTKILRKPWLRGTPKTNTLDKVIIVWNSNLSAGGWICYGA